MLRTSVMLRIAGGRAQFDRLSCCNRRRLIPTPIPLLCPSASMIWVPMCFFIVPHPWPLHPPTRSYFVSDAPCYLLLFLLLCPSASMIWVPMCFFIVPHPWPLHPPTRSYFVSDAPCYLLLFLLLFPSAATIWVPLFVFLVRTAAFCNRRLLLPTPIPFPCSINISDLGSYVLRSLCFFLGTAALPPATPLPACMFDSVPLLSFSQSVLS